MASQQFPEAQSEHCSVHPPPLINSHSRYQKTAFPVPPPNPPEQNSTFIPPTPTHRLITELAPLTRKTTVILGVHFRLIPNVTMRARAYDTSCSAEVIGLNTTSTTYLRLHLENDTNQWFILEGIYIPTGPQFVPLLRLLSLWPVYGFVGYEGPAVEVPKWIGENGNCEECVPWLHEAWECPVQVGTRCCPSCGSIPRKSPCCRDAAQVSGITIEMVEAIRRGTMLYTYYPNRWTEEFVVSIWWIEHRLILHQACARHSKAYSLKHNCILYSVNQLRFAKYLPDLTSIEYCGQKCSNEFNLSHVEALVKAISGSPNYATANHVVTILAPLSTMNGQSPMRPRNLLVRSPPGVTVGNQLVIRRLSRIWREDISKYTVATNAALIELSSTSEIEKEDGLSLNRCAFELRMTITITAR
ncbi:hypothetical protein BJ508DRAFT_378203 [Ascobolus immersus RN42]|uniref:Uncharacterized protein n=1 Tax=Ascobolus immersus RN42 TaxID=1160509 RepID=A0A3N4HZF4_ASCIM|nr:hypothetical protein BJ508DRAFT_378203 [Ascobolus immersus RN42]